nr:hypothetical protein [Halomonas sp. NyZ770]
MAGFAVFVLVRQADTGVAPDIGNMAGHAHAVVPNRPRLLTSPDNGWVDQGKWAAAQLNRHDAQGFAYLRGREGTANAGACFEIDKCGM